MSNSTAHRRPAWGLFLLAVLACPLWASFQTASKAVPAGWLHNGRLVVPELNFSVDTPTSNARWSYQEVANVQGSKATLFLVNASPDEDYIVTVLEKQSRALNAKDTKSFVDGMLKSLPKDWRVRNVQIGPTDAQVRNSSRFAVTIRLPDESTVYQYGYIIPGKRS